MTSVSFLNLGLLGNLCTMDEIGPRIWGIHFWQSSAQLASTGQRIAQATLPWGAGTVQSH